MPRYTEDENGYITIPDNPISKSGVFQYLGKSISPELEPEKVYNVYRPEQELNNPDTIESFKLTPWIPEHVMLGKDFTNPEDVGIRGVTGENVRYIGDTLYSNLKLFAADLKKWIEGGLKELSCGFRCKWIIQSGVAPDGTPYDVIQTGIRGNHLASVEQARMGSDVRVAMDRAVFALDSLDFELKPDGENMELKELIELAVKQGKQIEALTTAMDGMSKDMKATKEKVADMEEGKEKTAEDEEAEKEKEAKDKEKSEAMDAAIKTIETLTKKVETLESTAMDGAAVMKAFAEKQELASKVSGIVGAFDHADMDINGVAKYAVDKIGIACDSGSELATLKGYLAARQQPNYTVDPGLAQDANDATKSDNLDKLGL